jgi:hypothetical protein
VIPPRAARAAAMAPPSASDDAALLAECNRVLGKSTNLARSCREMEKRLASGGAAQPPHALLCRAAARLRLKECVVITAPGLRRAAAEAALAATEAGLASAPRCALLHVLRARALQHAAEALSLAAWTAADAAQHAAAASPPAPHAAVASARAAAEAAASATREAYVALREACTDSMRAPPLLLPAALMEEDKREQAEAAQRAPASSLKFPQGELHFWCAALARARACACVRGGGATRAARAKGCEVCGRVCVCVFFPSACVCVR